MDDETRERFKGWLKTRGTFSFARTSKSGSYDDSKVNLAWLAYKAGLEALASQPSPAHVCVFCTKEYGNEAELKAHIDDLHAGLGASQPSGAGAQAIGPNWIYDNNGRVVLLGTMSGAAPVAEPTKGPKHEWHESGDLSKPWTCKLCGFYTANMRHIENGYCRHVWKDFPLSGVANAQCCERCGIVKNKHNSDNPCLGQVRVELRTAAPSTQELPPVLECTCEEPIQDIRFFRGDPDCPVHCAADSRPSEKKLKLGQAGDSLGMSTSLDFIDTTLRVPHEPTRMEMMKRFSDKLSMEEIAEFAIWNAAEFATMRKEALERVIEIVKKNEFEYRNFRGAGLAMKAIEEGIRALAHRGGVS